MKVSNKSLVQRVKKEMVKWCSKNGINDILFVRHIYPRAYVVGRTAPGCIIVATPWIDSEPQILEWNKKGKFLDSINLFDQSLNAGDWCSVGYISTRSSGYPIAISVVK